MLRYVVRLLFLAIALALAWLGMGASDDLWRPILLGIGVALLVACWPQRKKEEETPLGHNVRLFGAMLLVVAMLLGLHLLRLQVYQSPAIRARVANLPEGAVQDTRPIIAGQRTRRGRIFDRNGNVLADIAIAAGDRVRRTYPRGDLGHIVGFYNPLYGNAGLEATYDAYLSGEVGSDPWSTFFEGLTHRPHQGNDLHLTLDTGLQESAEAAYRRVAREKMGSVCPAGDCPGSVVLLDARTGAVLALLSFPRYDPRPLVFDPAAADWEAEQERIALYWQGLISSTESPLLFRATSGLYPPGSTFKTLTAAAALESGLVTPESIVSCPNTYTVTGHVIVNFTENLGGFMQQETVLEDFKFSCNTAFAQIGLLMGPERYNDYAKRFGLTYRALAPLAWPDFTDLPAVPSTIARERDFLERPTGLADTAYGQGELQVTPLYMAMLVATVANDGLMMKPYLVERAVGPAGETLYQAQPTVLREPIGLPTARQLRRMMVAVVAHGTGRWWPAIEGVAAGGKTGSAEPGGEGAAHAWFIAFAPAEEPRYAVAVIVEHGGHGSEVAAPIARDVLAAALGR